MLTCLLIALPMSLWSQNDSSDGHEFIQERTLAPLAAGVPEEFTFDLSSVQFLDENPIHHIELELDFRAGSNHWPGDLRMTVNSPSACFSIGGSGSPAAFECDPINGAAGFNYNDWNPYSTTGIWNAGYTSEGSFGMGASIVLPLDMIESSQSGVWSITLNNTYATAEGLNAPWVRIRLVRDEGCGVFLSKSWLNLPTGQVLEITNGSNSSVNLDSLALGFYVPNITPSPGTSEVPAVVGFGYDHVQSLQGAGSLAAGEQYVVAFTSNGSFTGADMAINYNEIPTSRGQSSVIALNGAIDLLSSTEDSNGFFVLDAVGSKAAFDDVASQNSSHTGGQRWSQVLVRKPDVDRGNPMWLISRGSTSDNTEWTSEPLMGTGLGFHIFNSDCPEILAGCTAPPACNYLPDAVIDDGSCLYYDACGECGGNGDCTEPILGCTDSNYLEYNPEATEDDDSCVLIAISGCTDAAYANYNNEANIDDGSCTGFFGLDCVSPTFDGYTYEVVQIGENCWFAENLRTTVYSDGLPLITGQEEENGDESWWVNSAMEGGTASAFGEGSGYAHGIGTFEDWSNPVATLAAFGRLYSGSSILDCSSLCPSGWHVSTDEDWFALETLLGMPEDDLERVTGRGIDEGKQLKSPTDWWWPVPILPEYAGTNTVGFTALPGGQILNDGRMNGGAQIIDFWVDHFNEDSTRILHRSINGDQINRSFEMAGHGAYVRCVKGEPQTAFIEGCTEPLAINYQACATDDDGSCIYPEFDVNTSMDCSRGCDQGAGSIMMLTLDESLWDVPADIYGAEIRFRDGSVMGINLSFPVSVVKCSDSPYRLHEACLRVFRLDAPTVILTETCVNNQCKTDAIRVSDYLQEFMPTLSGNPEFTALDITFPENGFSTLDETSITLLDAEALKTNGISNADVLGALNPMNGVYEIFCPCPEGFSETEILSGSFVPNDPLAPVVSPFQVCTSYVQGPISEPSQFSEVDGATLYAFDSLNCRLSCQIQTHFKWPSDFESEALDEDPNTFYLQGGIVIDIADPDSSSFFDPNIREWDPYTDEATIQYIGDADGSENDGANGGGASIDDGGGTPKDCANPFDCPTYLVQYTTTEENGSYTRICLVTEEYDCNHELVSSDQTCANWVNGAVVDGINGIGSETDVNGTPSAGIVEHLEVTNNTVYSQGGEQLISARRNLMGTSIQIPIATTDSIGIPLEPLNVAQYNARLIVKMHDPVAYRSGLESAVQTGGRLSVPGRIEFGIEDLPFGSGDEFPDLSPTGGCDRLFHHTGLAGVSFARGRRNIPYSLPGRIVAVQDLIGLSFVPYSYATTTGTDSEYGRAVEDKRFWPRFGFGSRLLLDSIAARYDLSAFPVVDDVSFIYAEPLGNDISLSVNGDDVFLGKLADAPTEIAPGITLSLGPTTTQFRYRIGVATLTGNVQELVLGGAGLMVDHLCVRVDETVVDPPITCIMDCTEGTDFDALVVGKRYGDVSVGATDGVAPGDYAFTADGFDVKLQPLLTASGTALYRYAEAMTSPGYGFGGSTTVLHTNNIIAEIDIESKVAVTDSVCFEFLDVGGIHNLGINGSSYAITSFGSGGLAVLDGTTLGGIRILVDSRNLSVTTSAGTTIVGHQGTLTLVGDVNTLSLGGQELWMENLCISEGDPTDVETDCLNTCEEGTQFDGLTAGDRYGDPAFGATVSVLPGSLAFVSDGIEVELLPHGSAYRTLDVHTHASAPGPFSMGFGLGQFIGMNAITSRFLIDPVEPITDTVCFEIAAFTEEFTLSVNGSATETIALANLLAFDGTTYSGGSAAGGIDIRVTGTYFATNDDFIGSITFVGDVDAFEVGGVDVFVDNLCMTSSASPAPLPLPEFVEQYGADTLQSLFVLDTNQVENTCTLVLNYALAEDLNNSPNTIVDWDDTEWLTLYNGNVLSSAGLGETAVINVAGIPTGEPVTIALIDDDYTVVIPGTEVVIPECGGEVPAPCNVNAAFFATEIACGQFQIFAPPVLPGQTESWALNGMPYAAPASPATFNLGLVGAYTLCRTVVDPSIPNCEDTFCQSLVAICEPDSCDFLFDHELMPLSPSIATSSTHNQDGMDLSFHPFDDGISATLLTGTVFTDYAVSGIGDGQVLYLSNVNAEYDLSGLIGTSQVTLEYFDGAGIENLTINGSTLVDEFGTLSSSTFSLGGVDVVISRNSGVGFDYGQVTMIGNVASFQIGGQQFYVDNVCVTAEGVACTADTDGDGTCDEDETPGCTDELACNYSESATDDDGSCQYDCAGGDNLLTCDFVAPDVVEDFDAQASFTYGDVISGPTSQNVLAESVILTTADDIELIIDSLRLASFSASVDTLYNLVRFRSTSPYPGFGSGKVTEINNSLLRFMLPFPEALADGSVLTTDTVCIEWLDLGGRERLEVNGVEFLSTAGYGGLSAANGIMLGGVRVVVHSAPIVASTSAGVQPIGARGCIFLIGNVSDFALGGQEFFVDNLYITTKISGPEPEAPLPLPEFVEQYGADTLQSLFVLDTNQVENTCTLVLNYALAEDLNNSPNTIVDWDDTEWLTLYNGNVLSSAGLGETAVINVAGIPTGEPVTIALIDDDYTVVIPGTEVVIPECGGEVPAPCNVNAAFFATEIACGQFQIFAPPVLPGQTESWALNGMPYAAPASPATFNLGLVGAYTLCRTVVDPSIPNCEDTFCQSLVAICEPDSCDFLFDHELMPLSPSIATSSTHNQDGMDLSFHPFDDGISATLLTGTVFTDYAVSGIGDGQVLYLSNVNAEYDLSGLIGTSQVTLEYFDGAGIENLTINGSTLVDEFGTLSSSTFSLGGVDVVISRNSGVGFDYGQVTMIGNVASFQIGGQQFYVDNVCVTAEGVACTADTDGDGTCDEDETPGCTDELACNYSESATDDDGSCQYDCAGGDNLLTCDFVAPDVVEDFDAQASFTYGDVISGPTSQNVLAESVILTTADDIELIIDSLRLASFSASVDTLYNLVRFRSTSPYPGFGSGKVTEINNSLLRFMLPFPEALADGSVLTTDTVCIEWLDLGGRERLEVNGVEFLSTAGYGGLSAANGIMLGGVRVVVHSAPIVASTSAGVQPIGARGCIFLIGNVSDFALGGQEFFVDNLYITTKISGPEPEAPTEGCMYTEASNYDSEADVDDGTCVFEDNGCPTDLDGNGTTAVQDLLILLGAFSEECEILSGCTDPAYLEYDPVATADDGSCLTFVVNGCTDSSYIEYNPEANTDDGSCATLVVEGCTDSSYMEYNPDANTDDGSCATLVVAGCSSIEFDGYTYSVVEIGDQCWFAENLRTTAYANGDSIPTGLTDSEWTTTTAGATAVYGEGSSSCDSFSPDIDACDEAQSLAEYGRLYNWYAVDDARGLCPTGWHVPTDEEWTELEGYISSQGFDGSEGTALRSTTGWNVVFPEAFPEGTNFNGSDNFGFSALPSGARTSFDGTYNLAGLGAYFWTSTYDVDPPWPDLGPLEVRLATDIVFYAYNFENDGSAVRCLKDSE